MHGRLLRRCGRACGQTAHGRACLPSSPFPLNGCLVQTNSGNSGGAAADRKRRTGAPLDCIPESKRAATSAKPTRSAPVQPPPAPAVSAAAFASEGAARPVGPAPGDETFEDIAARTGATVQDVLGRKMQFKKGMKPEKKVEDMVPMIKDLRCVTQQAHGM